MQRFHWLPAKNIPPIEITKTKYITMFVNKVNIAIITETRVALCLGAESTRSDLTPPTTGFKVKSS